MKYLLLLTMLIVGLLSNTSAQIFQVVWEKNYGGSLDDYCFHSTLSRDSCIIAVGVIHSDDGDVHGYHEVVGPFEQGGDIWVIKINLDGDTIWTKALGGSDMDKGFSVIATPDSGCIVAGGTYSTYGQISINYGFYDVWIVKLDKNGNIDWERSYGGSRGEIAKSIIKTSDNGYLICGWTRSNDVFVHGNHNNSEDIWVIKLNEMRDTIWTKCLGGSDIDFGWDITELSDHNYLAIGHVESTNGDITDNYNAIKNTWVVKLDTSGNILWKKCYHNDGGGFYWYSQQSVISTQSGFLFFDIKDGGGHNTEIYKCNNNGDTIWSKLIPCHDYLSDDEYSQTMRGILSKDSNLVFVLSPENYPSYTSHSFLVEKINILSGDSIWGITIGDSACIPTSIVETETNSFVISGYKFENNNIIDFYLLKFKINGTTNKLINLNKLKFFIYPNPSTSGKFTIQLPKYHELLYVTIITEKGKILLIDKMKKDKLQYHFLGKLPKGNYILTLSNKNSLSSKKFIVQ